MKANSLFISDLHLGSIGCKHEKVLQCLSSVEAKNLFLVGDIIDGYRRRWTSQDNLVIRKILSLAEKKNVKVYYIPGNHDCFMRKHNGTKFGNIEIHEEYIYNSLNGRKLLICHGDKFDNPFFKVPFYKLGGMLYEMSIYLNNFINKIYRYFKIKNISFTRKLAKIGKLGNFRKNMLKYAQEKKCDGIVCGHIHTPEITVKKDVLYLNCGDFVESCSFIIEDLQGEFKKCFM